MKNLKLILVIAAATVLFTSCEKNETAKPGPQGPQGEQGNTNVESVTVSVSSTDWSPYGNPMGGNMLAAQKNVPAITSGIVSSGAVMVYMKKAYSNGGYYYQALPFSWVDTPSSTRTYGFSISTGTLNIHVEDSDNNLTSLGSYTFKVVAISGARLSSNLNIDLNNYEAVKLAFNLAD
jgi:hypothetical protein